YRTDNLNSLKTSTCTITTYCSFFFQAEDGIRDFHVTGVQTCALPIYAAAGLLHRFLALLAAGLLVFVLCHEPAQPGSGRGAGGEIGRASCRETKLNTAVGT